jgi:hypothetical protein
MYVLQFVDCSENKFVLVRYGDKVKNIVIKYFSDNECITWLRFDKNLKDRCFFKIAFPTLSRISESDQNG